MAVVGSGDHGPLKTAKPACVGDLEALQRFMS
jgi:hypothetical protein